MFSKLLGLVSGGLGGIYMYLIIGAVCLSTGFYGGYKITHNAWEAAQVKILAENQKIYDAEVQKAQNAENALEDQKEKNDNLTNSIQTQVAKIVTRTVYANVCLDADGLRLANSALTNQSTSTNSPNLAVPTPNSPK
jgi:hypothetical protein